MNTLINALKVAVFSIILAGSSVVFSGCGGGGVTYQSTGNKTLGQELEDLQASYDKGIITKNQYDEIKKKLIKKYTQ